MSAGPHGSQNFCSCSLSGDPPVAVIRKSGRTPTFNTGGGGDHQRPGARTCVCGRSYLRSQGYGQNNVGGAWSQSGCIVPKEFMATLFQLPELALNATISDSAGWLVMS